MAWWPTFKTNQTNRIRPMDLNDTAYKLNIIKPFIVGPKPVVGHYYAFGSTGGGESNYFNGLGLNNLRMTYWDIYHSIRIDQLLIDVSVIGSTDWVFRYGIYYDSGYNQPGKLRYQVVSPPITAAGMPATTADVVLHPGRYWVGGALQLGTGAQPALRTFVGWNLDVGADIPHGSGLPAANSALCGFGLFSVAGAFVDFAGPILPNLVGAAPKTWYRVAEVL